MNLISCSGTIVHLDKDGFLTDPDQWDDCVAQAIAEKEGVQHISKKQRAIVDFMRSYYAKHNNWPILHCV